MKRYIWVFLLISLPLAYSRWTYYCDGIKYIILCAGISLLALLYLFDLFKTPPEYLSLWKEDLFLLGLFAWALVSLTASSSIMMSLRMGAFFFAYYIVFYAWRYEIRKDEKGCLSLFEKSSSFVLFIVGLYAVMQYYGIYFIVRGKGIGPASIFSTLGHRNFASDMEAILFPVVFALFLKERTFSRLVFYMISLSVSWLSLYMMQSRGALTGFFIAFCLSIFLVRKGKLKRFLLSRKRRIMTLLSVLTILTVLYTFPNPVSSARFYGLAYLSKTAKVFENPYMATSGRVLIWRATLSMIATHPLRGVGLGRFGYNYLSYQSAVLREGERALNAKRAHNEYLQIWAEMGTPALLFFILFLLNLYRRVWKLMGNGSKVDKLRVLSISCGITAALAHAFFSFPFHLPANGFYVVLMMATLFGISDPLEPCVKQLALKKSFIKAVSLSLMLLCAFSFSYSLRSFASQYLCTQITLETLKSHGSRSEAERLLRKAFKAYKLDPLEPRALFFVAKFSSYLGDFKKALNFWWKFIDVEMDWNALYNLANLYVRIGKRDKAEEVYRYLLRLKPDFAQAWHNLGVVLREEGRTEGAKEAFLKAISLKKDYAKAYYNLGKLYIDIGDRERGIWYIRKAVGLDPRLLEFKETRETLGDP